MTATVQHRLAELRGLYRGVVGAACGAGIIIGTYFAFYSTSKNFLRRHSDLSESETPQQPTTLVHPADWHPECVS